jgi:hypothetical protein
MKLTDEQYAKLLEHIKQKWKTPVSCSVCGHNDWNVSSQVYEFREFHGGSMVIGGSSSVMPVTPVICNVCGNTVVINPLIAGIKLDGAQS